MSAGLAHPPPLQSATVPVVSVAYLQENLSRGFSAFEGVKHFLSCRTSPMKPYQVERISSVA